MTLYVDVMGIHIQILAQQLTMVELVLLQKVNVQTNTSAHLLSNDFLVLLLPHPYKNLKQSFIINQKPLLSYLHNLVSPK